MAKYREMKEESGMITFEIQIQEAGKEKRTHSFSTEKNLPLRRVFLDFCDQLGVVYGTIRFVQCDGRQVKESQTPEECEIDDGDVIDAFYEQLGEVFLWNDERANTEMVKEEGGMITFQIQIQEAGTGCRKRSFITEKTLPMRRVFLDFCDRLDLVYGTIRFYNCEGDCINEGKTAEEAGIEDGDVIDAFHGEIGDCSVASQRRTESGMITLRISRRYFGKDDRILYFKTEKGLPLRSVFLDFCNQLDLGYGDIAFLFDGRRVEENQTAEECFMEDGDIVDAILHQRGGLCSAIAM